MFIDELRRQSICKQKCQPLNTHSRIIASSKLVALFVPLDCTDIAISPPPFSPHFWCRSTCRLDCLPNAKAIDASNILMTGGRSETNLFAMLLSTQCSFIGELAKNRGQSHTYKIGKIKLVISKDHKSNFNFYNLLSATIFFLTIPQALNNLYLNPY